MRRHNTFSVLLIDVNTRGCPSLSCASNIFDKTQNTSTGLVQFNWWPSSRGMTEARHFLGRYMCY